MGPFLERGFSFRANSRTGYQFQGNFFLERGANLESRTANTHPKNTQVPSPGVEPSRINCLKVEVVTPPKGKSLSRIKATREGHRTTVRRIASAVNEELNTSNSDFNLNQNKQKLAQKVSKLRQQKETLRVKLEALKVLYEEIL